MITDAPIATAFLSCSLREEDQPFNDFVSAILKAYKIQVAGTVGKYDVASENPSVTMKKNIESCDFVVVAATPRYSQQDLSSGKISLSVSEQIHVESGIAYANNKPIVAFVKDGTQIGNFVPTITQYVVLDGTTFDYYTKRWKIRKLIKNVLTITVKKSKPKRNWFELLLWTLIISLVVYVGFKILQKLLKK